MKVKKKFIITATCICEKGRSNERFVPYEREPAKVKGAKETR